MNCANMRKEDRCEKVHKHNVGRGAVPLLDEPVQHRIENGNGILAAAALLHLLCDFVAIHWLFRQQPKHNQRTGRTLEKSIK